ncbi:hypothetical protein E2C01_083707 [Portunus trituberculatus]|uniref:Uncharacterized protein n=1 Tax=Portunus trituberculatus TaxID=210409 RepID=A0A5B7J4B9_PORTR|nr:hypothetical protein [Portunus trituberculatus]
MKENICSNNASLLVDIGQRGELSTPEAQCTHGLSRTGYRNTPSAHLLTSHPMHLLLRWLVAYHFAST